MFLMLVLHISMAFAQEGSSIKIDQAFKDANRLDISDLYEKPKKINIPATQEAEISSTSIDPKSQMMPKVEVIFDSSGSMGQIIGRNQTRMYAAKRVVAKFFKDQWKENALMGLRVYGARRRNDCKDTYLAVPFGDKTIGRIENEISVLLPVGRTPLLNSVKKAIKDIEAYEGPKRIVVFTDGKDTCGGDLCKFAREIRERDDIDVKIFTVGINFSMKEKDYDSVSCLGESGGNLNAESEDELFDAMSDLSETMNPSINLKVESPSPKAQVNLYRIVNGKPVFYRSFTAAWGITVPPGEYQADVLLKPAYKFPPFKVPKGKKVTLRVAGFGKIKINFPKSMMDAQLLNPSGKVMHHFKSGSFYRVKMGVYKLKIFKKPYYEFFQDELLISPNGVYEIPVPKAGSVIFKTKETQGFYIYDKEKKLFGNYLTNIPLVLPRNDYYFYLNSKCEVSKVDFGSEDKIGRVTCQTPKKAGEK